MVIASQIAAHMPYDGVVPELASRLHLAWINRVYEQALREAGLAITDIDAVAATKQPGLSGSLLVGHSFGKALACARNLPFIGIDHMLGHLYAACLESEIAYPHIGLLVSGGHSLIVRVEAFDTIHVLGASIDDAVGEAFDKIARHYGLGYPGGKVIDEYARKGNSEAFKFPIPNLYKGHHPYDVSFSGLKNAAINQLDLFWDGKSERSIENIAASFEKTAIDIMLKKLKKACEDTGINTIVAGGGVAANHYLRSSIAGWKNVRVHYPSLTLCGDNAAMIAGLAWHYLQRGDRSPFAETVQARVRGFRKAYPEFANA